MHKILLLFFVISNCAINAKMFNNFQITKEQARKIGQQIWRNECAGSYEGLTSWNNYEDFASLGIGHFIWHPKDKSSSFKESFPSLLWFMKTKKVKVPQWLNKIKYAPWENQQAFFKDFKSIRMKELRNFLVSTIDIQAEFIIKRMNNALPLLVKDLGAHERKRVAAQFYRVACSGSQGLYALVDYINFKGYGISSIEDYKDTRWGLLQVLQNMKGNRVGKEALNEFASSAEKVLLSRIKNAPRPESQWWPGWKNRINTYRI